MYMEKTYTEDEYRV